MQVKNTELKRLKHTRLNDSSELTNYSEMIVNVAGEILTGANIESNAIEKIMRDLAQEIYLLCEQNTMDCGASSKAGEDFVDTVTSILALLKLQVSVANEATSSSARLMSMYELLRHRLHRERSQFRQRAKEATHFISTARRSGLILEWSDRLDEIADIIVVEYIHRYNGSATAVPRDLQDLVSPFVAQADAAWRLYLRRLRSQKWIDGCQRVFKLRLPV